jgi:hypothetical protein
MVEAEYSDLSDTSVIFVTSSNLVFFEGSMFKSSLIESISPTI